MAGDINLANLTTTLEVQTKGVEQAIKRFEALQKRAELFAEVAEGALQNLERFGPEASRIIDQFGGLEQAIKSLQAIAEGPGGGVFDPEASMEAWMQLKVLTKAVEDYHLRLGEVQTTRRRSIAADREAAEAYRQIQVEIARADSVQQALNQVQDAGFRSASRMATGVTSLATAIGTGNVQMTLLNQAIYRFSSVADKGVQLAQAWAAAGRTGASRTAVMGRVLGNVLNPAMIGFGVVASLAVVAFMRWRKNAEEAKKRAEEMARALRSSTFAVNEQTVAYTQNYLESEKALGVWQELGFASIDLVSAVTEGAVEVDRLNQALVEAYEAGEISNTQALRAAGSLRQLANDYAGVSAAAERLAQDSAANAQAITEEDRAIASYARTLGIAEDAARRLIVENQNAAESYNQIALAQYAQQDQGLQLIRAAQQLTDLKRQAVREERDYGEATLDTAIRIMEQETAIKQIMRSMIEGGANPETLVSGIFEQLGAFSEDPTWLQETARMLEGSVSQMMSEVSTEIVGENRKIIAALNDAAKEVEKDANVWRNAGQIVATALVEGVNSILEGAAESWAYVFRGEGQTLLDSIKQFFGIASPSRVFAEEVGRPIAEGVAAGIEMYGGRTVEEVSRMVSEAASAVRSQIAYLSSQLDLEEAQQRLEDLRFELELLRAEEDALQAAGGDVGFGQGITATEQLAIEQEERRLHLMRQEAKIGLATPAQVAAQEQRLQRLRRESAEGNRELEDMERQVARAELAVMSASVSIIENFTKMVEANARMSQDSKELFLEIAQAIGLPTEMVTNLGDLLEGMSGLIADLKTEIDNLGGATLPTPTPPPGAFGDELQGLTDEYNLWADTIGTEWTPRTEGYIRELVRRMGLALDPASDLFGEEQEESETAWNTGWDLYVPMIPYPDGSGASSELDSIIADLNTKWEEWGFDPIYIPPSIPNRGEVVAEVQGLTDEVTMWYRTGLYEGSNALPYVTHLVYGEVQGKILEATPGITTQAKEIWTQIQADMDLWSKDPAELMGSSLGAVTAEISANQDPVVGAYDEIMTALDTSTNDVTGDIEDKWERLMTNTEAAIANGETGVADAMYNVGQAAWQQVDAWIEKILTDWGLMITWVGNNDPGSPPPSDHPPPNPPQPPPFATGGSVLARQAIMVGEMGPELFVPSSAGKVLPNSALRLPSEAGGLTAGGSTIEVGQIVVQASWPIDTTEGYRIAETIRQALLDIEEAR